MKYQLPKNLKNYRFFCEEFFAHSTYQSCKKLCSERYKTCWERMVRKDLAMDCAVENEIRVRKFLTCPKCGGHRLDGILLNRFLCADCDLMMSCAPDEQKELMGDEYLEIDAKELDEAFSLIK